jgi:uncharacterized protein
MLNLSLTAIERGGEHGRWEVPAGDPLWEGAVVPLTEPVRIEVDARSIGSGAVLVRGTIQSAAQMECRRCSMSVRVPIEEDVDLLFEPLSGEEADDLAGEVYPLPTRGDVLDIADAVREQLLLNVPGFVLCDEACRGLCAQCGTDLNRSSCECAPAEEASPWDALRGIKFD